jgi:hypothetical protein
LKPLDFIKKGGKENSMDVSLVIEDNKLIRDLVIKVRAHSNYKYVSLGQYLTSNGIPFSMSEVGYGDLCKLFSV